MRIVVAHFSKKKAIKNILINACIVAVTIGFALFYQHGNFAKSVVVRGGIWLPIFAFGYLGVAYLFLFEILLVKQVAFDKCNALWIENGMLIYLHRWYVARTCTDILGISAGNFGRNRVATMVVQMRNGERKVYSLAAVSEDPREIIASLKLHLSIV